VRLDHQAVDAQVESLLRNVLDKHAASRDVTGIGHDRDVRMLPPELDRELPHRRVAEPATCRHAKAAVNDAERAHAGAIDPLERADPQAKVRAGGILHQHGHIHSTQRVRERLHGKRIHGRARANPQQVDTVMQRGFNVSRGCHLGGGLHAVLPPGAHQPRQGGVANALEACRPRPGLPDPGAEVVDVYALQATRALHHLRFALGAARPGDDERSAFDAAPPRHGKQINAAHDILLPSAVNPAGVGWTSLLALIVRFARESP
jgi:hypothetical protein